MRKARSVAWFSTAGFHQRSKWKTWLARGQVQPGAAGLEREEEDRAARRPRPGSARTIAVALRRATPPCRNRTSRVERRLQVRRTSKSPISANWVKNSARSPAARTSSSISVSRASLPERRPIGEPSPEELRGMVADLLELGQRRPAPARVRWMPSASSSALASISSTTAGRARPAPGSACRTLISSLSGRSAMIARVGLEPAQDERAGEALQLRVAVLLVVALDLDRRSACLNSLCGAQEAGVEELHDRPELADVVLDRACR